MASRQHAEAPASTGYGILVSREEELYAAARKAHEAAWQIGAHANGDAAIDIMLRIYERLQREMPRRDPRYRLEHRPVVNHSHSILGLRVLSR